MVRFFAVLFFVFFSSCGFSQNIFPENDLWKEDCLACENAKIDETLFSEIIKAGYDAYNAEAQAKGEKLEIKSLWSNPTVNASACRGCKPGEATIRMYGGLARRDEILPESFALVLCHELGHLYGGDPYIDIARRMSAEGQADFYSTNACFEKIYARVPTLRETHESYEPFMDNCGDDRRCKNGLAGARGLGELLAVLSKEDSPKFETPDQTVVNKTQLSYPDTIQCRLDTYAAGMLLKPRPLCWFKP